MAKTYTDIHSFVGGLLSAKLEGRIDFSKYGIGCRVLENMIVTPTGGIYRRPGLRFVAKAKAGQTRVRLIPFDFNGTEKQSYVLEVGDGYIRFFTRGGQVVVTENNEDVPLELTVAALEGKDLSKLCYVQSADCIYFAHPQMYPWRLERTSNTSWAYQQMSFSTNSRERLPWAENDYPSVVRIYENRLIYASSPTKPLNIWMSKTADFTNMNINTQSDQSKDPYDEDAIFMRLNGSRVNPIKWMLDMEQLVVGTNQSEIKIQGSSMDAPLTPKTAGHRRQSSYGSNDVKAILLGSSAMFVSRTGTNVYTLDYQDFGYRFKSAPLNLLCPEATTPEVVEMHSMGEPEPIAWCILSDGTFSGCTYIRDQQIYAWHKHSTDGKVISGAVIPYLEGDQFWMAVKRGDEIFIEYLETPFDIYSEDATYSVFMDSMLSGTTSQAGQIRGAAHLVGKTVQVMQNGSYIGEMEVGAGGVISDERIVANAYVAMGLPYTAEVQPMRVNYSRQNMNGVQGVNVMKRILSVVLRVVGSVKGEIRAEYEQPVPALNRPGEFGEWQEILAFGDGAIGGNPPPCLTKNIEIPLSGNSSYDGLIRVRQRLPFPLFLSSISYGIELSM